MPNTILFKKTAEFELTFEDFFERFYDVGEEDKARRVFEAMSNVTTDDAEGDEGFDFFLCQIEQAKEEAEEDLATCYCDVTGHEEEKLSGNDDDGWICHACEAECEAEKEEAEDE